ncbi:MAG: hypothetical protein II077_08350, partial [Treponema sp.]|nr:hypothetical protein [Treponema sp.]
MTKKTQSDKKSKNNTKQKPPPYRTRLCASVTQNAIAANRHADRICGKPSRRTHLPPTATHNAIAANRHAELD